MSETDTTGDDSGFFVESYANRFGEPRFTEEAYGYWLFVAGAVLGVLGLVFFLLSTLFESGDSNYWATRQAAGFAAGVGLPTLMLGVVYRLPVKGTVDRIALAGVGVCTLATILFVVYFPRQWNARGASSAQDFAAPVTVLYGIGLLVVVISALLLPVVTERREPESAPEVSGRSKASFELFKDKADEWRWNLRHGNGNIIADSAEGYSSKQKAKQGLKSVRKNVVGAPVKEKEESEEVEEQEGEEEEDEEEEENRAKYKLYEDEAGKWRWRLVAPNGRIVADSGQGYKDRRDAEASIGKVRGKARDADHLDITPAGFEVYEDDAGEWRWRLIRQNGRIITDSGEGYTERNDATEAVKRVRDGNYETEVYEDDAGECSWRLVASNGRTVADSAEGYEDEDGANEAAESFEEIAPEADTVEGGDAYFSVYEDKAGEWRWSYISSNGNVVADSGEGYTERNDAVEALERVKEYATARTA